jgi:hypothetical protein
MSNCPLNPFLLMGVLVSASLSIGVTPCWSAGLDDTFLAGIRDGFEVRQTQSMQRQMFVTFPGYSSPGADNIYVWNRLNFALAALFQFKDDPESNRNFINAANKAIIDASEQYLAAGASAITRRDGGLHWHGNHWVRLHEYFGSDSRFYPGLLSEEAEASIRELIWHWVSRMATLENADVSNNNTWRIWESENHSAMKDQLAWGGAKILRRFEPYRSRKYNDGSTAEEQYEAWTNFLIAYLRERGKRGLFVEYRSNTYVKYTMQNFYNYLDLSGNPTLRELARSVLDLMWADAALETLDGFVGGASARQQRPTDLSPLRGAFSALGWFHYGEGQELSLHPGHMMLLVSRYRIPYAIMDIALDHEGRGAFEYVSRRPGLSREGKENSYSQTQRYYVDYEDSQILRYSYVTPNFVLGTHVFPNLSNARWTNISSQNRFHSALLRAESDFVQIVPQARATGNLERGLNELWSIQRHGTLITQKLRTSQNVAEMRVYIPSEPSVEVQQLDGWIFIDTGYTYSGVRVAAGGYQWQDDNWIELDDEYAPVILEVARAQDYQDFQSFQTAALSRPLEVVHENGNRRLEYSGLSGSGEFVFSMDTDDLPTIDGEPYDLAPDFTYKSPFLNAEWPASKVYIGKHGRSLTLDFDLQLPAPAEMHRQWRTSTHVDRTWYHLEGFGWFVPATGGWLFHYAMGWLYSPPTDSDSVWLYLESAREWIWASPGFSGYYRPSGQVYVPAAG